MRRAALGLALLFVASPAAAQMRPGGGGGAPSNAPTQSSPTQSRTVGPRAGAAGGDDEDSTPTVTQRAGGEPIPQPPADPLAISPEMQARIGTDSDMRPPAPVGDMHRSWFPYYEERKGDYRFRFLPPLWLEHTRGLRSADAVPGEPTQEDRQSLYGLLYYQRRSPTYDADVLFPLAWRVRDRQNHVLVLGPIAHREAPGEHDNWLAPLFFEGSRPDGGYFHAPLLLTTTHSSRDKAFTLVGTYFRDRSGGDVDAGIFPLWFHGDNGNTDGARRRYTLIPPLLTFHKESELDESSMTVVGPLVLQSTPKRSIFDIAPLFFHIEGKPQSGGVHESHTTLFPLFHYGYKEDESLFVLPGYLRRTTASTDTLLTPLYSHATTRNGATSLTAIGPILPLFWNYRDRDTGASAFAIAPLYYQYDSPTGHDFLTPIFGSFQRYGLSRSYWLFPTITYSTDTHGWDGAFHPLLYVGRSDDASHTVVAPVFWDFASAKGRTTIGFPVYWRFADRETQSVTQVAANTVYVQKRVQGGLDWQFHLVPFFSYGEDPNGYFWNVLFGLAGYQREGSWSRIRAFWIPITVGGAPSANATAGASETDGARGRAW